MLKMGVKHMSTSELNASIDRVWNIKGEWKLVTLGKEYFNIQMADLRERDGVFLKRSWTSEFGTIRLQKRPPDFNPYKISSSTVNVWVRIFELLMKYFHELIIEDIASAPGPIVNMDERTRNREMKIYARVLIKLDLRKDKEYHIMY